MTKLMKKALEALPDDWQDELAGHLLDLASQEPVRLSPEEKAAIARGTAAAGAG